MLYQNFVPGMKVNHKTRGAGYIVRLLTETEKQRRYGNRECVFDVNYSDMEGYYSQDNELTLLELPKDFKQTEVSKNYIRRI